MNKPRDIDYLLEEVVTLPSLPRTVAHISQLISDPDCSLATVAKAISADPAIALKTLRLVNSAFYGLRQKVSTVEHAVVLLGMKVIKNLVFTATVFDTLKGSADALLRHSVSCGVAMRVLIENNKASIPVESSEEAFIYGLLHDIGIIIFEQFLPKEFEMVNATCVTRRLPRYVAEREIIGMDHAFMGARLARKWKLPENLVNVLAGHHDIEQCENPAMRPVSATLSVADYICTACAVPSTPHAVAAVSDEAWAAAHIASADVPPLLEAFFEAYPGIDELVQLAT